MTAANVITRALNCQRMQYGLRFDKLRRTPKPHDAHEHETIYALDQCVFKASRESHARRRASLHALQLRADSQVTQNDSRNGGWSYRAPVGNRTYCEATRPII